MMQIVYRRNGKIFVPTIGRTEVGSFKIIEPMDVFEASDRVRLAEVLRKRLDEDNPLIPMPKDRNAKPAVLTYAGVKSWTEFINGTLCFHLDTHESGSSVEHWRQSGDGGFEPDPTCLQHFQPGTPANIVLQRFAELIIGMPPAGDGV